MNATAFFTAFLNAIVPAIGVIVTILVFRRGESLRDTGWRTTVVERLTRIEAKMDGEADRVGRSIAEHCEKTRRDCPAMDALWGERTPVHTPGAPGGGRRR